MGLRGASISYDGPPATPASVGRTPCDEPRGEPISLAPDAILRRYASLAHLSDADLVLLRSLALSGASIPAGKELEGEGASARSPRLLVSGWAYRFRILSDGRRMIVGFLLPGDAICPCRQTRAPALFSTAALTSCRLVDAKPLWRAVREPAHAGLAEAQHLVDTLDECYLLDHVVRLGRQTAIERICHLLLEFCWRLQAVGLARSGEFAFPLTQEGLADAVGLSVVHVNRTLQTLRRRGFVKFAHGRVALLDQKAMNALGEFRPPLPARTIDRSMALASR